MAKFDNQLDDFFGIQDSEHTTSQSEGIRDFLARKLSFRARLRLLPKVLSFNERYLVVGLALTALLALASIPITTYRHFTTEVPAQGGSLIEGALGTPRLVNPLLAQTNDADNDLTSLIFSGLYRYNGQGVLVPDLAKTMPEITPDGLSYSITLREDARWHDGVPVTADDIVFTVQTAQNADYGAPATVRAPWVGVQAQRISDHVVQFRIDAKYAQFSNNLTLGILPKHLWQDIKPINFSLSELNIKPIGSGPFRFKSLTKDNLGHIISYKLEAYNQSHLGRPKLDSIEFRFFDSEDGIIDAFNANDIDNVGYISGNNISKLKFKSRINLEEINMPRYFSVFFNQSQSKALSDKNVRLALNYATDRVDIINRTLNGKAFLVNSPMIGGILDINPNVGTYNYDPEQAASILQTSGWNIGADGIRAKNKDNRLELTITTSTWPELMTVAQAIKEQWEKVGAKVTLQTLPISELQTVIKNRNYQTLLFGEILPLDPDPFVLWHSSQKRDPGINLALYDNATADKLLEEARQTLNATERKQKYDDFQRILLEDIPAVFLYSPKYLYGLSDDVQGFETALIAVPSQRFTNITNWYVNTQRIFR